MDASPLCFDFCDQLIVQDQLVFKETVVVMLTALRAEMMAKWYASHTRVEGCLHRVQESMFWPRMLSDIKEFIAKCDTSRPSECPTKENNRSTRSHDSIMCQSWCRHL